MISGLWQRRHCLSRDLDPTLSMFRPALGPVSCMIGQVQMTPWRITDYQLQTAGIWEFDKSARDLSDAMETADLLDMLDECSQKREDVHCDPFMMIATIKCDFFHCLCILPIIA